MRFSPGIFTIGATVSPRIAVASGATAALLMAGFFVISRAGIQGAFTPVDLTFFRYASAIFLLPIFLRNNPARLGGLGWRRGLVLAFCGGAAMNMLMASGLVYAPVAHASIFTQGTTPMFAALLSMFFLGDRLTPGRVGGLVMILAGLATLSSGGIANAESGAWRGDLMFLGTSILWASFTVLLRTWRVDPVRALAIVAVVNFAVFAPIYFIFFDPVIMRLPVSEWWFQAVYQMIFVGIFAAVLYMRAVPVLGPARTALAVTLVPVFATIMAITMLGEVPGVLETIGMVIVLAGIVAAMGVRLNFRAAAG
ncbi:MAG: DMT family transporter [Rhodospirillales bacterium]|nr:DMT family transporter [Rhodospirillales bacterium]